MILVVVNYLYAVEASRVIKVVVVYVYNFVTIGGLKVWRSLLSLQGEPKKTQH